MGSGAAGSGGEPPSKISERAVMAGQDEDRIFIAFPYCCILILSKQGRVQSLKIGAWREPSVLLVILVFGSTRMAESFEVLSAHFLEHIRWLRPATGPVPKGPRKLARGKTAPAVAAP